MKYKMIAILCLLTLCALIGCEFNSLENTPSPTATATATNTAEPTATPTLSPTPTVTVTPTATVTPTPTPTATISPTPEPTPVVTPAPSADNSKFIGRWICTTNIAQGNYINYTTNYWTFNGNVLTITNYYFNGPGSMVTDISSQTWSANASIKTLYITSTSGNLFASYTFVSDDLLNINMYNYIYRFTRIK